jgi:8-oxo-dGTP diphosphatase
MKKVTAAIWLYQGKVLIARRPPGDTLENLWEFPGGKVEPGEDPESCLSRELMEEFGVRVTVGAFFGRSIYTYESGTIELLAYLIEDRPQEMEIRAHSQIRWADTDELGHFAFAPADIPLVEMVKEHLSKI